MATTTVYTETTPNVKTIRDAEGQLWLCDASVAADANPSNQSCVRAEDVIYDRMFGG